MDTLLSVAQAAQRYYDLATEASDSVDMLLCREAVNRAHQRRCVENKWTFMLSREFTLAVEAGVQEYMLPHANFDKINYLFSTTQGGFKKLTPTQETVSNLAFDVTLNAGSATAREFQIFPDAALHSLSQEFVGVQIEVNNANDGGKGFYIEGIDGDGNEISETLTTVYTGPSGPNIVVSEESFTKITYYAKVDEFEGTVSVDPAGGGVTLIDLPADVYMMKFPVLRFVGMPTQAETCVYRFYKQPRVLTRDRDSFDIPFPHSGIILYDTLLDLATYSELDSESVNIWRDKQQEYLGNLYLNQLQGDAVGGRTPHTQEPMY